MSLAAIETALYSRMQAVAATLGLNSRQVHLGIRAFADLATLKWHGHTTATTGRLDLWMLTCAGSRTVPAGVNGLALAYHTMQVVGYIQVDDVQKIDGGTNKIRSEVTATTQAEAFQKAIFSDYTLGGTVMNCVDHQFTLSRREIPLPDGADPIECHYVEISFTAIERTSY